MELEIVERLCRRFPNHPAMKLGPGDDAAILELAGSSPEIVVSTDLLTEGVDFLLARMDPRKIGRKALAVNLSDLAAMAAEPLACVISVALPKSPLFPTKEDLAEVHPETSKILGSPEIPESGPQSRSPIFLPKGQIPGGNSVPLLMEFLCEGFLDAAEETARPVGETGQMQTLPIAIAGGDTNTWDGPLVLSVTVIGRTAGKPLCRNQAQPGDAIFVTGPLGGSLLRRQFEFVPRVQEMLSLNAAFTLHAGMDISDGLSLDLLRLCRQSRCSAELFPDQIPISSDAVRLSALKPEESAIYDWITPSMVSGTPLEHALGDGEDFEVLFTAPWEESARILQNSLGIPVFRIGRILEKTGNESQIFSRIEGETPQLLAVRGFCH